MSGIQKATPSTCRSPPISVRRPQDIFSRLMDLAPGVRGDEAMYDEAVYIVVSWRAKPPSRQR